MADASGPTEAQLAEIFGGVDDPMEDVERRAHEVLPGRSTIVWEGDAATFHFSYVGRSAEGMLGYPASRWTTEPAFWSDVVVHPEDRDEAVAYCALCTGKALDHDFTYRAVTADGRVLRLHDLVRVLVNERGTPERLRGLMIDVTEAPPAGA